MILDLVREHKPPFSPEAVTQQFANDLKRYRCSVAFSDAHGGQWVVEEFAKAGITITPSPLTRSELYLEALPLVNSATCELLDHGKLLTQLQGLERRAGRSGRDAVDHRPGAHDDIANSACGALVMTTQSVGLKAPLPEAFTECINPVAAGRCAFLFSSPWFPLDAHCRKYCPGLRAVLPAYQQHQQQARAAGDQPLTAQQFLKTRFEPNRMMNRLIMRECQTIVDGLGF